MFKSILPKIEMIKASCEICFRVTYCVWVIPVVVHEKCTQKDIYNPAEKRKKRNIKTHFTENYFFGLKLFFLGSLHLEFKRNHKCDSSCLNSL